MNIPRALRRFLFVYEKSIEKKLSNIVNINRHISVHNANNMIDFIIIFIFNRIS